MNMLPCPFCGGEAKISGYIMIYIECSVCKCRTSNEDHPNIHDPESFLEKYMEIKRSLTKKWNKRCHIFNNESFKEIGEVKR